MEESYEDEDDDYNDLPNIEGMEDDLDEVAFMDCEGDGHTHSSDSTKRRRIEEEEEVYSAKNVKF